MHPGRLLYCQAQRFNHEARDHNKGQRCVGQYKTAVLRQFVGGAPAAPGCKGQSDEHSCAGNVENQLVSEIDVPLKELFAENIVPNIPVQRCRSRTEE